MASTSREESTATAVQQPSKTMQNLAIKEKYIENYDFMCCAESNKYEKVAKIGQGTFGEVFKAREKNGTRKFVAMKKVLMENEKEGVSVLLAIVYHRCCLKHTVRRSFYSFPSQLYVKFAFSSC